MRRILFVLFPSLLLSGCLAFYSAHTQFVRSMNTYADSNTTIDEYDDPSISAYRPANKDHLTEIERLDDKTDRYHFKRPGFWGFCHYYFDVDRATRKVIGWGFDEHLADPKKTCGASG